MYLEPVADEKINGRPVLITRFTLSLGELNVGVVDSEIVGRSLLLADFQCLYTSPTLV